MLIFFVFWWLIWWRAYLNKDFIYTHREALSIPTFNYLQCEESLKITRKRRLTEKIMYWYDMKTNSAQHMLIFKLFSNIQNVNVRIALIPFRICPLKIIDCILNALELELKVASRCSWKIESECASEWLNRNNIDHHIARRCSTKSQPFYLCLYRTSIQDVNNIFYIHINIFTCNLSKFKIYIKLLWRRTFR